MNFSKNAFRSSIISAVFLGGITTQVSAAQPTAPHIYLRCNTTGWGLAETNRFKELDLSADFRTLDVCVKSQTVVQGFDDCTLTISDTLNSWGGYTKHLGMDGNDLLLQNSPVTFTEDGWDNQFKVQYPGTGAFTFLVNLNTAQLSLHRQGSLGVPANPGFSCNL